MIVETAGYHTPHYHSCISVLHCFQWDCIYPHCSCQCLIWQLSAFITSVDNSFSSQLDGPCIGCQRRGLSLDCKFISLMHLVKFFLAYHRFYFSHKFGCFVYSGVWHSQFFFRSAYVFFCPYLFPICMKILLYVGCKASCSSL